MLTMPAKTPEQLAKLAAYQREWTRKNPRKLKEYNLRWRYGLTLEEFDAIIASQNDACAVCFRPFNHDPQKRDIVVDHNHDTGQMRGIVCAKCNAILGRVDRDVEILKRAVAYLERVA
jgi:hypothetical protein